MTDFADELIRCRSCGAETSTSQARKNSHWLTSGDGWQHHCAPCSYGTGDFVSATKDEHAKMLRAGQEVLTRSFVIQQGDYDRSDAPHELDTRTPEEIKSAIIRRLIDREVDVSIEHALFVAFRDTPSSCNAFVGQMKKLIRIIEDAGGISGIDS